MRLTESGKGHKKKDASHHTANNKQRLQGTKLSTNVKPHQVYTICKNKNKAQSRNMSYLFIQ